MTEFKKIELSDISKISEFLKCQTYGMCDFTAPVLYMWRDYFLTEFLINENHLILRHENFGGKRAYLYPICKCGRVEVQDLIYDIEIKKQHKKEITFCLVPEEKKEELIERFVQKFKNIKVDIFNDVGWNDYIYLAEKINGFKGKSLHGQKNHLNNFNKNHPDCEYIALTPYNAHILIDFTKRIGLPENSNEIERTEYLGVLDYLENFEFFPNSFGGFLVENSEVIAYSIAEKIGEYLIIHNEKANTNYRGAYQKIFDCTMKNGIGDAILYINREEDCGDEGLRYAKNSYHPEKLLKKYTITFSGF